MSATTTAKADILARIRGALGDTPAGVEVPRAYSVEHRFAPGTPEVIDLLKDRLIDYKANVYETPAEGVAATVEKLLAGESSFVVPAGLPAEWLPEGEPGGRGAVDKPFSAHELDAIGAVVTGCRVACAETGTIVLDGEPDQGRRAITLVPDHHICVVLPEQVVGSMPEAVRRLEPTRPTTMIAGPSATSDIELVRVEGVHGPRTLDVILVR